MPPNFIRHVVRRALRTCVLTTAPLMDRVAIRAYCSRLNAIVRWFMAGTETIRYGGATVCVATSEMMGYFAFFSTGRDQSEIARLAGFCHDAELFADVGANIGLIALPVAARSPRLDIIGFEPDSRNRQMLEHNVALNPSLAARIRVAPEAAADTNGTARFASDDQNFGNSRIASTGGPTTHLVPTVRLDDYFVELGRFPEVVKIDVEGAELGVLRGMSGLFATHPPHTLFIEVHAFSASDPAAFKQSIRDLLVDAGYLLHHPYANPDTLPLWDNVDAWPSHFSLLARHRTAIKP